MSGGPAPAVEAGPYRLRDASSGPEPEVADASTGAGGRVQQGEDTGSPFPWRREPVS